MHKTIIIGLSFLLGILFLVSGISKIPAFSTFIQDVQAYRLLPAFVIPFLSALLIAFEILLGISLFIPGIRRTAGAFAAVLMVFFLALSAYARMSGISQNCGCFGFAGNDIAGWAHIMQNLALLAFSILVYFYVPSHERRQAL